MIRKLLAGGAVEHHSEFFDFEPVQLAPVPQAAVPIWVGGHSIAALHRPARWEGWVGINDDESDVPSLLQQLAEVRR